MTDFLIVLGGFFGPILIAAMFNAARDRFRKRRYIKANLKAAGLVWRPK